MTLAIIAVLLGAVAQATSGLGFALVSGPLLFATLGPAEGLLTVVTLSSVLNAVILIREHRAIRYADCALVLVPAVVTTLLLARRLGRVDADSSSIVAGTLTVVAAVLLLRGLRIPALGGRFGAAGTGVVSAVMNSLAGIGGPPVALYTANANWSAAATRASMQAIFLVLNLTLLSQRGLPNLSPALLAAMAVGYAAGVLITRRLSESAARRATLLFAVFGGVALVVRSV